MGGKLTKALPDHSSSELSRAIETHLGSVYSKYAPAIAENCVDGALIAEMSEAEFQETLEDLGITSRLHCRVLTKAWKVVVPKELCSSSSDIFLSPPGSPIRDIHQGFTSPVLMDYTASPTCASETNSNTMVQKNSMAAPGTVSAQFEAAAEYELTPETPNSDVGVFDSVAERIRQSSKNGFIYAGVNLLSPDQHVGLGSRLAVNAGDIIITDRIHVPVQYSQCVNLLLDKSTPDFVQTPATEYIHFIQQTLKRGKVLPPWCKNPHYYGHVVRSQTGEKIGMVCLIEETDTDSISYLSEQEQTLMELAQVVEQQLDLRRSFLQRKIFLRSRREKKQANPNEDGNAGDSSTRTRRRDTIITLDVPSKRSPSELSREERESLSPIADDLGAKSVKTARSYLLPKVQENLATTKEELAHLPSDYFDLMEELNFTDPTPVPKNDRERCAAIEAIGLIYMDPSGPTGRTLKSIATMTATLLDVPFAHITFLTHDTQYSLATYMNLPKDIEKKWTQGVFKTITRNVENSKPFLSKSPRQMSICNYVAATEETFVVHDIHADETFSWVENIPIGLRFYSGSPIRVNGQILATLCILDWRPRPDFTKAQEIQQEQLAAWAGREIENYTVRREIEQIEEERKSIMLDNFVKNKSPPENDAAIVFTNVQGSTKLWKVNPNAMENALMIHDRIMRTTCAEFNGYEVSSSTTDKGGAFQLAFHDSLDAIGFALKLQCALHEAPWGDNILQYSDAAEVDGFRGLRVRVVVHYGPVRRMFNELSNRTEYTGETLFVTKSMEDLAVGGQIVVTQDAWRGAAYLAESKLGSPQVIDIGKYVLQTGETSRDGVIAKQLFQLLPKSLAYDYFGKKRCCSGVLASPAAGEARKRRFSSERRSPPNGRKFPPIISSRMRLSPSFHDAPAQDSNIVTIIFVLTSGIEELYGDSTLVLAALKDHIGSVLLNEPHLGGYQCQNNMLAFPNLSSAAQFGLSLIDSLSRGSIGHDKDWSKGIKVGICEGEFTSMGPHPTTGRADYFGTVVNRAARVADFAENGQVCIGVPVAEKFPKLRSSILSADFIALKELGEEEGIEEEFALFSCSFVP